MKQQHTLYELEKNVVTITLNRPNKLNAFTTSMRNELIEMFQEADANDAVRAVIVTGAGRAFCAGADLSEGGSRFDSAAGEGRSAKICEHRDGGGQVSLAIFSCRKPVIAAITVQR